MSSKSNDNGRAFEFITLNTLYSEISRIRPSEIIEDSCFYAAKSAYERMDPSLISNLKNAAVAMVKAIFDLEPLILEDGNDILQLFIQPDERGEEGDVRDIIVVRRKIHWEIGFSMKHNHFAVKHSRLSPRIDFGEKWYGYACSSEYHKKKNAIFSFVSEYKRIGAKWSEVPNKENNVYIPLLNAFTDEILKISKIHPDVPSKLVEYLLGKFDFYKVVSVDRERFTEIQTYNLHGTLGKSSKARKSKIIVPIAELPTRIISMGLRPNSNNTVELYMNNGWQFSFRIHNASTLVEESLKFDIQIIGMPTKIITINCKWL